MGNVGLFSNLFYMKGIDHDVLHIASRDCLEDLSAPATVQLLNHIQTRRMYSYYDGSGNPDPANLYDYGEKIVDFFSLLYKAIVLPKYNNSRVSIISKK